MIGRIHVLFVSEDDGCEKELAALLQAQPDFSVSIARSQEEAKRHLQQESPDVSLPIIDLDATYAGMDKVIELLDIDPIKLLLLALSTEEKEAILDAFKLRS